MSTLLAQPKRLALLAYLAAARPRGFHSRDRLLALFWPEADGERARNSLRQALHHLRRSLGEDAVPGRGDREVGLDLTRVECDVVQFDAAIEEERWVDALHVYGGDFLPGLFVQDAPEAEQWLDGERSRMRRSALRAATRLAYDAERSGDLRATAEWLERAIEIDPDDEGLRARRQELRGRLTSAPPGVSTATRPDSPAAPSVAPAPPVALSPDAPTRHRKVRRLVATVAGIAVVLLGVWYASGARGARGSTGAHEGQSVAVLPFVNMSGDPANDFFSDGISEELLNLLAQVPGLQVAARTSSFTFKGKNVPVDSIGRVLRVRHVLEGSVRQSGPRVRITAQLIDATTGYHLWSGTFDRRLEDLFAVQDSIGRVIVDVLRPRLTNGSRSAPPQRREPNDPEAHVAVLKGWRAFRVNTPEGWAAAGTHFEDAIRRDSGYGRGWAGLATVRVWQANFRIIEPDAGFPEAVALARRALSLDSTLSEAHVVLGFVADVRDWNYAAAEAHYARAIAANPSDTRGYSRRATMLARLGRADEAIASATKAVQLDPASPAVYSDLANTYERLNQFDKAEQALRSALTLDPGHPILLGNLATNLTYQKRFDAAVDVVKELRRRTPANPDVMGRQAYILARAGRMTESRAVLDSAASRGLSRMAQATIYEVYRDTARVLELLEQGVRERDAEMVELLDSTQFVDLRGNSRMRRLVEQVRSRK